MFSAFVKLKTHSICVSQEKLKSMEEVPAAVKQQDAAPANESWKTAALKEVTDIECVQ